MNCPNCRSEIGSRLVCPYCGRRINDPLWPEKSVPPRTGCDPGALPVQRAAKHPLHRVNRSLSRIEMYIRLTVVLLVGMFLLQILACIILILK